MYTIENNLLHLHLGCHPKWDFCHHKWDSKIPSGVADFLNEFLQKLNQITVKRGGHARAAAHTSHFRWQNFKYSLFITSDHFCCFLAGDKAIGADTEEKQ